MPNVVTQATLELSNDLLLHLTDDFKKRDRTMKKETEPFFFVLKIPSATWLSERNRVQESMRAEKLNMTVAPWACLKQFFQASKLLVLLGSFTVVCGVAWF